MDELANNSLREFHPLLAEWFSATYSKPTEVQELSWPRIRKREHVLISAPTGSGKTLTAFFALIDRYAKREVEPGHTSCLYVSPLKALNNDIQRNLLDPLAQLQSLFTANNEIFPAIRVLTRSGDTPQNERQKMIRRPPEILVTTPESLLLMLSSARSRTILSSVECVVVDEVHALVDNRRGASLMTSLEWLADLSGEFQRIALSATVSPFQLVSDYIAGIALNGSPRQMVVLDVQSQKKIDLKIRMPKQAPEAARNGEPIWDLLIDEFRAVIEANRSTLLFSQSRRMAERIALSLNSTYEEPVVYSHHGSLSREIRSDVESKLKNGELRGLVATSSLEMGIDIGSLDEVILVQSPSSIASTRQRIGRAGHNVGETSRAQLFPTHALDLVEAAVLTTAIQERDLEPLRPMYGALDLLAQLIVAMVLNQEWNIDTLFDTITRSRPYAELERSDFELILDMLTGKYEGMRIRSLRPRIAINRKTNSVVARKGASMAFYSAGGTIPDRGYFRLRLADQGTLIGELDEEFVWEAKVGQPLSFGTQSWVIDQITHSDVTVRPAGSKSPTPPFWRSEFTNRDFYFSDLIGKFLKTADTLLEASRSDELEASLRGRGFDETSATELVDFLQQQKESTGAIPHSELVVAERTTSGPGGYTAEPHEGQLFLHTAWGGRVNRPIALALESQWRREFDSELDVFADNSRIVLQLMHDARVDDVVEMLMDMDVLPRLRESLESSGLFGRLFRECAGRALLISKARFDQRVPLWMTRMQSKKLLEAAQSESDFPILMETWRTCLNDEFDMPAVDRCLTGLRNGSIRIKTVETTNPSPFARDVAHDQVSRYMYADDSPDSRTVSNLSDELIARALQDSSLRPEITGEVVNEFERKTQRREVGYQPIDELELGEWVKERVWIPQSEWFADTPTPSGVRLVSIDDWRGYVHEEVLEQRSTWDTITLGNALQFYGPRSRDQLESMFPLTPGSFNFSIDELIFNGSLLTDVRVTGVAQDLLCDAENLEILLRFQRRSNRLEIEPITSRELLGFWIRWLELDAQQERTPDEDFLVETLSQMRHYSAPLNFWLHDLWRSRYAFDPGPALDSVFANQDIVWWGCGEKRISVGFDGDTEVEADGIKADSIVSAAFVDPVGRYTFKQLVEQSGVNAIDFNGAFWSAVWRGEVSSDNIAVLKQGQQRNFQFDPGQSVNSARRVRARIKNVNRGWPGSWYRNQLQHDEIDPTLELEDKKERVRILLARYGVLNREIANREQGLFRWSAIFEALRVMELSGEVLAGLFVSDMSGPQFAHRDFLSKFEAANAELAIWISALDIASPCGLNIDWNVLPQRRTGNYLGTYSGDVICVVMNRGRRMSILVDVDDQRLAPLFRRFTSLFRGIGNIPIEEINGKSARQSEYRKVIETHTTAWVDHSRIYVET